ncbi:bifunctional hydroxymethylpyrimidine kinase/phosphomethylpyrimidine kinase [Rickettsiella endosymbiont of Miltochrista miniata]|uniref:bifunctional hydroxymethylpyrimidine kinase/phosphomethylpyrimidine kinase n=1 Tax=Rickettsiella endosymbiont of Miltochrista miniata TaxID=3066239 RepID=UPI00313CEC3E
MSARNATLAQVVTLAGTDPSGGAGIQADIKAISATGSYAASIITILVAQNTESVTAIQEIPLAFIQQQIDAVFTDLSIDAVKLGMLYHEDIIHLVAANLKKYQPPFIVLDPVMISQSGHALLKTEAIQALVNDLFPLATLITPNIPEAESILSININGERSMQDAAILIATRYKVSVLLKGGHLKTTRSPDIFYDYPQQQIHRFDTHRINTKNTHGTGCTLSAAIASYLAQGENLYHAIVKAKHYLTQCILAAKDLQIGHGQGPVHHFYFLSKAEQHV